MPFEHALGLLSRSIKPEITPPKAGDASKKVSVQWKIRNMDTGEEILPQQPIDGSGVSFPIGGTYAEQPRFGFQDSITHWTQGVTKTFTFSTVLYATDKDQGPAVKKRFFQLQGLAEKNNEKGRPPICLFTYGTIISETVLVESVSPTIVDLLDSGDPREVRLSITLRKYVPFSQKQIDTGKTAKESFFLVASAAERSYEAIAKRYYGDPLLGDRLRKRHKGMPFAPDIGAVVKVPSRAVVLGEVVEPESHILSLDEEDAVDNFERILEARNAHKLVEVI